MLTGFFQELKRSREEKRISLADIADSTLINIRYLEAIERGNTAILPEAYVRAFIREYASAIGLDPDDTMRRFDEARRAADEKVHPRERPEIIPPVRRAPAGETRTLLTPRTATIAVAALLFITVVILAWNVFLPETTTPVTEIPFQNVVKEHEQRTAQAVRPAPPPEQTPDSLTLFAAISDTVWMTMAVDSLTPREYIFRPGTKASWRANNRFTITLGNAGAVAFTLNQKPLGALGKKGYVVRNAVFTRQILTAK